MITLVLWLCFLALAGYLFIRIRVHAYLGGKITGSAYGKFFRWEDRVLKAIIVLIALGFAINFIRTTPLGMPKWIPVLFVVGALLWFVGLHYKEVVKQLWFAAKEPFRKVDKRDLKWRIRSHLNHTKLILEKGHPTTWSVITAVKLFIQSKRKVV